MRDGMGGSPRAVRRRPPGSRRKRPLIRWVLVSLAVAGSVVLFVSLRASPRLSAQDPGPGSKGTQTAPSPLATVPPGPVSSLSQARPPFSDRASFVTWMLAHTDQKQSFLNARWDASRVMLQSKYIRQESIIEAFLMTPREYFSRDPRRAYDDAALPIGYGQTISSPKLVARMTEYLDIHPGQKVLEIGTGSGYQAALLSEITTRVYSIEIVSALAAKTDTIYQSLMPRYPEYQSIQRTVADGYYGWSAFAPFDRIIVTCGIDHIPPDLLLQLVPEGIMIIPVGPPSGQTILRIVKHVGPDGSVRFDREDIFQGRKREIFVPFTSKSGGRHTGSSG